MSSRFIQISFSWCFISSTKGLFGVILVLIVFGLQASKKGFVWELSQLFFQNLFVIDKVFS